MGWRWVLGKWQRPGAKLGSTEHLGQLCKMLTKRTSIGSLNIETISRPPTRDVFHELMKFSRRSTGYLQSQMIQAASDYREDYNIAHFRWS